jgi:hypothetical protein
MDRRHVFQKEISMRKLFALVAIVGLGVSIVGCGDTKKKEAKPAGDAAAPAAPAAETK